MLDFVAHFDFVNGRLGCLEGFHKVGAVELHLGKYVKVPLHRRDPFKGHEDDFDGGLSFVDAVSFVHVVKVTAVVPGECFMLEGVRVVVHVYLLSFLILHFYFKIVNPC